MLQLSKIDKNKVLESIKSGKTDADDASFSNFIDTIILKLNAGC